MAAPLATLARGAPATPGGVLDYNRVSAAASNAEWVHAAKTAALFRQHVLGRTLAARSSSDGLAAAVAAAAAAVGRSGEAPQAATPRSLPDSAADEGGSVSMDLDAAMEGLVGGPAVIRSASIDSSVPSSLKPMLQPHEMPAQKRAASPLPPGRGGGASAGGAPFLSRSKSMRHGGVLELRAAHRDAPAGAGAAAETWKDAHAPMEGLIAQFGGAAAGTQFTPQASSFRCFFCCCFGSSVYPAGERRQVQGVGADPGLRPPLLPPRRRLSVSCFPPFPGATVAPDT